MIISEVPSISEVERIHRFRDLELNSVVLPTGDDDMVGKCRVRACFVTGNSVLVITDVRVITVLVNKKRTTVLATLARRISGTPASGQVIFKWAHTKGFVVVTTTAIRTRLDEYLGVVNLRASPSLIPPRC